MAIFDPTGDFAAVTDGLETVSLSDRDGVETVLDAVLRRAIRTKEVQASNGLYLAGDLVFHLSTSEQVAQPMPGWSITDSSGIRYTVLEVRRETLGDRWRCVTRNLAVAYSLTGTVQIMRADTSVSQGGAIRVSGYTAIADARASVQVVESGRAVEGSRTVFADLATIVLEVQRTINGAFAILDGSGRLWKPTKVSMLDRIDSLMEIEAERTPWPLS